MAPTLSAQLCLGLCLCWGIWAQEGPFPRPSLRADPGLVIPRGKPVTLWCEGTPGAHLYRLKKEGSYQYSEMFADVGKAHFLIPSMDTQIVGRYRCLYGIQSLLSEASDPLELIMTSSYDPPSLSALPSSQVTSGQQVTLLCQSQLRYDRSALYKDGEGMEKHQVQTHSPGAQANFSIAAVTPAHGGTYRCYTFHSNKPYVWSAPSDPLVLRVAAAPNISSLQVSILMGISTFLILLVLFLLLLLWHRHWRLQTRIGNRDTETKATRSSDPARKWLEEKLYENVGENRPENTAALPGVDPQEVIYAKVRGKGEKPLF